jgi:uncharacterized membrane protein
MAMRVHEVHPAVVHAPLALLPLAALSDLRTALRPSWRRRYDDPGAGLWWATAATALFAGVAGLAASQQVHTHDERAERFLWLHGLGNVGLVAGAIGIAAYRSKHRASVPLAIVGLVASGASALTAYLGGEMVYEHGVGVRAMPEGESGGDSPRVLSWRALPVLVRDAVRGLGWLVQRTAEAFRRERQPLSLPETTADEGVGVQPVSGY